jgi:anti-anti-sigma factor
LTDPDGIRRVMLIGEVDLGTAERLLAGLARRRHSGAPVRLDLSQLAFVDCCGLRAVLQAVEDGRCAGCEVEIDRALSWPVARMIDFAGVAPLLWPQDLTAAPA